MIVWRRYYYIQYSGSYSTIDKKKKNTIINKNKRPGHIPRNNANKRESKQMGPGSEKKKKKKKYIYIHTPTQTFGSHLVHPLYLFSFFSCPLLVTTTFPVAYSSLALPPEIKCVHVYTKPVDPTYNMCVRVCVCGCACVCVCVCIIDSAS